MSCHDCKVPARMSGIRFTIGVTECDPDSDTKIPVPLLATDTLKIYVRPIKDTTPTSLAEIDAALLTDGTDGKMTALTNSTDILLVGKHKLWGMVTRVVGADTFQWPTSAQEVDVVDHWA